MIATFYLLIETMIDRENDRDILLYLTFYLMIETLNDREIERF
jgi:hypothetical protein